MSARNTNWRLALSPEEYHDHAMRTAAGPEVFHYPTEEPVDGSPSADDIDNEFIMDFVDYLKAAAKLDDWKSRLFYGKPKYHREALDIREEFPHFPDFDEYLEGEMSLSFIRNPQFIHAILGIATEGAELAEDLLKGMKPPYAMSSTEWQALNDNSLREAGDISWYLELFSHAAMVPVPVLWAMNIDRLRKRFPDKFTEDAALDRADEKGGDGR